MHSAPDTRHSDRLNICHRDATLRLRLTVNMLMFCMFNGRNGTESDIHFFKNHDMELCRKKHQLHRDRLNSNYHFPEVWRHDGYHLAWCSYHIIFHSKYAYGPHVYRLIWGAHKKHDWIRIESGWLAEWATTSP